MQVDQIDQVRRFNRTVTQRVGALNDEFLARDRPLGQARVLWEIGPDGCDVRLLRSRLDLDSGYLSRLLRSLENDGLIAVNQHGADGRVRTARLTSLGLAERAELDQRAQEAAESVLQPLSDRQRTRLVEAMAEVERLMIASMVQVAVVDPRLPAVRSCVRTYFAELGRRFDDGYDPSLSVPATDAEMSPPTGLFLLASLHEEPVGCGGLKLLADGSAEIKRMWVAPSARGLGLGRRLLAELEEQAVVSLGSEVVKLETNRNLTEAIGMYRSAGYQEIPPFNDEPYAHHWFAKTLSPPAS
jgi:DNA-binding MarR family transcriptional regulator/ribosomal protein S18 acetylase RimI-like enzyme